MTVYLVHGPQASDSRPVQILSSLVHPPTTPSSLYLRIYQHVPGTENAVDDALSRPFSPPSASAPSLLPQPVLQAVDLEFSTPGLISPPFKLSRLPVLPPKPCCPAPPSPLSPSPFLLSSVFCDVSSGSPCPLVPKILRKNLFMSLHGISHPGVGASRRLLSSRFVWPGLSRDIGLCSRACLRCQQSKVKSLVKSPVPSISVPGRRFSYVHLDLVGPLP